MSEEDHIIRAEPLPPPPPPAPPRTSAVAAPAGRRLLGIPLTADASKVLRKASTWVAALAAALSSTAGAALLAYAQLPQRAQDQIGDAYLALLAHTSIAGGAVAFLIPLATSWAQRGLQGPKP